MKHRLSDSERKVLAAIQHGMPLSQTPFEDMASDIGLETEQLLGILKDWKDTGELRRIGAIVNHFSIGLSGGAMVVWKVASDHVEEVGAILAAFPQVSHAYERPASENWPFNIYTMVHGTDMDEVAETVIAMSEACGITEYCQLLTERELKKVPPTYIQ